MSQKIKSIATRFLKAFVSGALGTAGAVTILNGVKTWHDLLSALSALVVALLVGGISGVLMAGEKLVTWQDDPAAPAL